MEILSLSEGNVAVMPLSEACDKVSAIWRESMDVPVNSCFDNLYALAVAEREAEQDLPDSLAPQEPTIDVGGNDDIPLG